MNYWVHAGLANAVLALVPGMLALVCQWRGGHARLVRALWVVALVKLLTPPVVGLPVGWLDGKGTTAIVSHPETAPVNEIAPTGAEITAVLTEVTLNTTAAPAAIPAPEPLALAEVSPITPVTATAQLPTGNPVASWITTREGIMGILWCCGSVVVLAWGTFQIAKFRRLARSAREGSDELRAMAERVGARLGLRRLPAIAILDERMSPVLWGLALRPLILLPRGVWDGLTQREQEALLAHELAHYGRGDHWVRWIEFTTQVIYWWHPLVWAGARQMRRAEEEATDGAVVSALPDHRADYARALLAVVEMVAGTRWRVPAGGSGMSEFTDLTRRMQMIMEPKKRKMNAAAWAILAAGSLALVPVVPVGGAGANTVATPSIATAEPTPTMSLAQVTPAPAVSRPQETLDDAERKLSDERKRLDDERKKLEETRRQLDDRIRKMDEQHRQQTASTERGRVADETAVKLRELELSEFMDTGKNITTSRLEAEMRTELAQVRALDAKSKRLTEAVKNGMVGSDEMPDVEAALETAKARANIAQLELEAWKKYGITKKQLQLQQQLEEAQRTLAVRRPDANASSSSSGSNSTSATQSPVLR